MVKKIFLIFFSHYIFFESSELLHDFMTQFDSKCTFCVQNRSTIDQDRESLNCMDILLWGFFPVDKHYSGTQSGWLNPQMQTQDMEGQR